MLDPNALMFVSSSRRPVGLPRSAFFERFAQEANLPNASSNTVRWDIVTP